MLKKRSRGEGLIYTPGGLQRHIRRLCCVFGGSHRLLHGRLVRAFGANDGDIFRAVSKAQGQLRPDSTETCF
jgi:hypothetical protein